jgi:cytochrome c6
MSSEQLNLSQRSRRHRIVLAVLFSLTTLGRVAYAETGASQNAASTFKTNCASCHGSDGKGSPLGKTLQVPDLSSKQVQAQSSASLARVISEGKGNMPAFGNHLDAQQIQALAKYIHHFGTKPQAGK